MALFMFLAITVVQVNLYRACTPSAPTPSSSCASPPTGLPMEDELFLLQTVSRATQRVVPPVTEDLRTGEEGEEVTPLGHPSLLKTSYTSKPEFELAQDRKVLDEQLHLDRMEADVRQAFSKLKAETYQSADFSRWRMEHLLPQVKMKRRMQLLAATNMEKAAIARDESERARNDAYYEKSLHNSQDAIMRDREAREKIWQSELKKQEMEEKERAQSDLLVRQARDALSEDRRKVADWEAKDLANLTAGLSALEMQALGEGMSEADALQGSRKFTDSYKSFVESLATIPEHGLTEQSPSASERSSHLANSLSFVQNAPSALLPQAPPVTAAIPVTPTAPGTTLLPVTPVAPVTAGPPDTPAAPMATLPVTSAAPPVTPATPSTAAPAVTPAASVTAASPVTAAPATTALPLVTAAAPDTAVATTSVVATTTATVTSTAAPPVTAAPPANQAVSPTAAPTTIDAVVGGVPSSTTAASTSSPVSSSTVAPVANASAANYQPKHDSCTPQCAWQCESKKCDELCAPSCEAPKCKTRCRGYNMHSCRMECERPHCAVVCPKRTCPLGKCPHCSTKCSKPMCKMQCDEDEQPCHNICEQPNCTWKCKAPTDCAKPKCTMVCETPGNCMTYDRAEPPPHGYSDVKAFLAPGNVSLSQSEAAKVSMLRVPIVTEESYAGGAIRHVELPVAPVSGSYVEIW